MTEDEIQTKYGLANSELSDYFGELVRIQDVPKNSFDDSFKEVNPDTVEKMNEFYRQDDKNLFRQMHWRPVVEKQNKIMVREILNIDEINHYPGRDAKSYISTKVLDYGCGVGTLGIILATLGCDISLLEIKDSKLAKFAEWRFQKRFLPYTTYGHEDILPEKTFDVVLFIDVLEHVTDVKFVLDNILRGLKSKGYLFLSQGWYERKEYPILWQKYSDFGLFEKWLNSNFVKESGTRYKRIN